MNLSDKERKVMRAVYFRADRPVKEIARVSGLSEHAVRYCLRDLIERGILIRRTSINIAKLGYSIFGFWCSLDPHVKGSSKRFIDAAVKHPNVGYVGEFGGNYQFKLDIYARGGNEALNIIGELAESCDEIFTSKTLMITTQLDDFPLKFLAPQIKQKEVVSILDDGVPISIDLLDHRLLSLLGAVGDLTLTDIARKLGVSGSTLRYRMEALVKAGVISRIIYYANPFILGLPSFIHFITTMGPSRGIRAGVREFAREHQHVYCLTEGFGAWDFEMCSILEAVGDELSFREEILDRFSRSIAHVETAPIFRHFKVNNYPFTSFNYQTSDTEAQR